jgi:hypothetical protein
LTSAPVGDGQDPVVGEGSHVQVHAAGADAITVKGVNCTDCERSFRGSCDCPAGSDKATLRLYHGNAPSATSDCYRSAFDHRFCSATPHSQQSVDTLTFFVEIDAPAFGTAATICRQANPATGACTCVAGQSERRLPLPMPLLPRGQNTFYGATSAMHNVTFCAPDRVSVVLRNPVTGGCIQPLGASFTCGCSAGAVPMGGVTYRHTTYRGRWAKAGRPHIFILTGPPPRYPE